MKIKYSEYDDSLTKLNYLNEYDKINVFINLESVFKYISCIQELERKIMSYKDFNLIMISNILNLAGHYKYFFKWNNLDANIYLYNTDLKSNEFHEFEYNDDFRSYYLTKYNSNPKYTLFSDILKDDIIPNSKTYCEFIPNIYYITSMNIEGSLVPYIISKKFPDRKNLIITGEFYDTQYTSIPNFVNHFIHRYYTSSGSSGGIYCNTKGYLKEMTKKSDDIINDFDSIYKYHNMYCSLISVLGDRQRCIQGLDGIGPMILKDLIKKSINEHAININTTNPEMLANMFTDKNKRDEFIKNYYCSNLDCMYNKLTNSEINSIINQIIDRSDINGIKNLNNTIFYNHPLILDSLL
jgi:hypothetical protein